MAFPVANHNEGDLSLVFQSDHTDIYTLSFTIGPGGVAGLDADHAMYIGRLQGTAGVRLALNAARKAGAGRSPAALGLAGTGRDAPARAPRSTAAIRRKCPAWAEARRE